MAVVSFLDPKKPNIRLPQDDEWDGGNPYAEGATKPPVRDWQVAGRGWDWYVGVIGAGVVFGAMAWWKSKT